MPMRDSLLAAVAGILIAGSVLAAPSPRVQKGSVMLENTGSTNSSGYRIYLSPNGAVRFANTGRIGTTEIHFDTGSLPKAQTQTLFRDLAAAGPMSALLARHGMRSASFGSATFITYKGQRSPDMTFPVNAQGMALSRDVYMIAQSLHLGGPRQRLMRPLLPASH